MMRSAMILAILAACHAPRVKPAAAPLAVQRAPAPHHPSRSDPVPAQPAFAEVLRDPCGLDPRHHQQLAETVQTGQCAQPKYPAPIVIMRPARHEEMH
jgi:hypothetical protein